MRSLPRYRVGRDVVSLELTPECAVLEGARRLRPGHIVELTGLPSEDGDRDRRAMVETWVLVGLGKKGPVYRGTCRWLALSG